MAFSDNKPFWESFLSIYQSKPCLWKVKSKDYVNKDMKNEAYSVLIEKCKEINPEADLDYVKKKIDSLRNGFRRELRKTRLSQRTGSAADVVPTLWYFDLLSFTMDQEEVRTGMSSISPPHSTIDPDEFEELFSIGSQSIPSPSPIANRGVKNKKPMLNYAQKKAKFLEIASNALETQPIYLKQQAFGQSVSADLNVMDDHQCTIAKKLISDVLYHGKLGNLNVNSSLSINVPNSISYSYPVYQNNNPPQYNYPSQCTPTALPMSSPMPRSSIIIKMPHKTFARNEQSQSPIAPVSTTPLPIPRSIIRTPRTILVRNDQSQAPIASVPEINIVEDVHVTPRDNELDEFLQFQV